MIDPNDDTFKEFKVEAFEMLEQAEEDLMAIDRFEFGSNEYQNTFNSLFRTYHSLKGAAGMFGLSDIKGHMHHLENLLELKMKTGKGSQDLLDYMLLGVDSVRRLLKGEVVEFSHLDPDVNKGEVKKQTVTKTATVGHPKKSSTLQVGQESIGLVYIVDDEEDIREILSEIASSAGLQFKTFENPLLVAEEMKKDSPDCILSDIKMPQMTGIELIKKAREINAEIPIILISGHVTKEDCLNAISNGVYSVIEKPFNTKEVFIQMIRAVRRYRTSKLIDKALNLLMYQFSDLDEFLRKENKESLRQTLRSEMELIIKNKKLIDELKKKVA